MAALWVGNLARTKEMRVHTAFYLGNLKVTFHLGD